MKIHAEIRSQKMSLRKLSRVTQENLGKWNKTERLGSQCLGGRKQTFASNAARNSGKNES